MFPKEPYDTDDKKRKKIAAFIDYDNISISLKNREEQLDYDKLLEIVNSEGYMIKGRIYLAYDGRTSSKMYELWKRGFQPVHVPTFRAENSRKSLADSQIICDIMESLLKNHDVEQVVIVSGDKDFIPVIRKIAEWGKEVRIIAVSNSLSNDLSEECIRLGFKVICYDLYD